VRLHEAYEAADQLALLGFGDLQDIQLMLGRYYVLWKAPV